MRWFLLAALLVTLAGCEYRYAAVADGDSVYVIDKQTGQVLLPRTSNYGVFGPLPKYPKPSKN